MKASLKDLLRLGSEAGRRRGLAAIALAATAAVAALWAWRGAELMSALGGRPADLSVAAWTSLVLLIGCAVSVFVLRHPARTAEGRESTAARETWHRFRSRRASCVGLWGCLALLLLALLSPALAPYDPNRIGDSVVTHHRPPLSRLHVVLLRDGSEVTASAIEVSGEIVRLRRGDEWINVARGELLGGGSRDWRRVRYHLLGTDHLGRDLLSRLLVGSRVSLAVGLLSALFAALIGGALGAIAGASSPRLDATIMSLTDTVLSFPRIFLLLLLLAVLPGSTAAVISLLALTGWMGPCRLVRAQVLSLREREFVQAARAVGRRPAGIVFRHLLPNALTPLIVAAGLRVGDTMLAEAGLSFLGLGVPPPHATWGNLISAGRPSLPGSWWISIFPGLAIATAVVAFNLLGDGLREALEPRTST